MPPEAIFLIVCAICAVILFNRKRRDTPAPGRPLERPETPPRPAAPKKTGGVCVGTANPAGPAPVSAPPRAACSKAQPPAQMPVVETPEASVAGPAFVVDGDTVVIRKTSIRLYGIDAPEIDHPYGKKAKWALVNLCRGQPVHAVVTGTDTHGRTVARCYLGDGRDLSAEMVRIGLAIDWPKYSGGRYRHLEVADARKKLWLADARQRGHMHVWKRFEAQSGGRQAQR